MKTTSEKVALLEDFDAALEQWHTAKLDDKTRATLRKTLNELAPEARGLVRETGCNKILTLTPPPAIGGLAIRVDVFDMIFENYFGMSLIPQLRDVTQQAIGVFQSGRLEEVEREAPMVDPVPVKELDAPDKVTLIWLIRHVPVSLWLIAAGLLLTAFTIGLKASQWSFMKEIFGTP